MTSGFVYAADRRKLQPHEQALLLAEGSGFPCCSGEESALVGRQPGRVMRYHERSCPVRGPGWVRPRQAPRVDYNPPRFDRNQADREQAKVRAAARRREQEWQRDLADSERFQRREALAAQKAAERAEVRRLRAEGVTLRAIAARFGVHESAIRQWLKEEAAA